MTLPRDEPDGRSTPKVFICYRREETAAHAGRLYDAMVARFGEGNVFMDMDLKPGVDFVERITEVVAGCLALLVVIGPRWATVEDEGGGARIADPTDFVRLEVETGLGHSAVTPIPVLVGGARMPKPEELPTPLRALTRRNAVEMSEARWGYDVGRLIGALDELLPSGAAAGDGSAPKPSPRPATPGWQLLLEGMLVAGVAAYAARWLVSWHPVAAAITSGNTFDAIWRRAVTWAVAGAALAVWLAARTRGTGLLRLGLYGLLAGALAGALGGAVWAVPVHLAGFGVTSDEATWIDVGSLAVTGGVLGALIGALWLPRRIGAGLAGGLAAGASIQLLFIAIGWNVDKPSEQALKFAIVGSAITGVTLATMLTLGEGARRPTPAGSARRRRVRAVE